MADRIGPGVRVQGHDGIRVGLSGELDLQCLPELETALCAAFDSDRRVWVDLSRVTFLDALCLRELAVQYQLHSDRLVLWRPSAEVRLTVAICGAEDWVGFYPESMSLPRPRSRPDPTAVAEGGPGQTRGLRRRCPPR